MTSFVAVIDYRAGKGSLKVVEIKSKDMIDAMNEAENLIDNSVYMVQLAKRIGNVVKTDYGKDYHFLTVLCNRGNGWYANDDVHSEISSEVVFSVATMGFTWYEIKMV